MSELWKPVVSFEADYEVSNFGRIRRKSSAQGAVQGRILKPLLVYQNRKRQTKRVRVCLYRDHNVYWRFVHHVVMLAFVGPRLSGYEVNHKDGNPCNNHLDNLEYVTHKQNQRHASQTNLMAFGQRNGANVLSEQDVRTIRAMTVIPRSDAAIARAFGVATETIRKIRLRKTWAWLDSPLEQ